MKKPPSILLHKADFEVHGHPISVRVFGELRYDTRYGLRGHNLTIRIPAKTATVESVLRTIEEAKVWVSAAIEKSPKLQQSVAQPEYTDGQTLQVGDQAYLLHIRHLQQGSHTVSRKHNEITLSINQNDSPAGIRKAYTHLLSRMVASHQKLRFFRRVDELNDLHFKVNISDIRFKYNTTNWGSCSSQGSLNFSTRLLFAPLDVQDYVIIHELAHRIELNHSDRFWALVAAAMPDYTTKEHWLKANSTQCRF